MTEDEDESGGTPSHMAPELLYPKKFGLRTCRVSKQADIYAIGMVIYEVLTGRPFRAENFQHPQIMTRIIEGKRPREPEKAEDIGFGGGTWELVQQCWHQDREERPTVEKVSEHFQRVAGTSLIVPPGRTIPDFEEEAPIAPTPDRDPGWCPLQLTQQTKTHLAQRSQFHYSPILLKRASSSRSGLPRTI